MPPKSTPEDFWKRVDVRGPNDCWNWIGGSINSSGYGTVCYHGRHIGAHVCAYELVTGQRLLPGMDLRHTCDNRRCCNPAHHLPGTRVENMQDATERHQFNQGSKHGNSKLTEPMVVEILDLLDAKQLTQAEIAKRYGIAFQTVSQIARALRWKHLP